MRQDAVERPWDALEVECLHQEDGVPLLAVPHEAVQLVLERPVAVRGLLLVRPERAQLALLHEHALHSIGAYCPRQLVLEVARASVEPNALELVTVVAPQRTQEMPLLADVIEPSDSDVAVLLEEAREVPVAAHRHDGDALGLEIATTALRKRLDGAAVARALDEHYSARLHSCIRSDSAGMRGGAERRVVTFLAWDMVTIPLTPVDAVRITILMDNVTDPLLFPTEHVERTTWFHHLARSRIASNVTDDGLPDCLIAQPGFSALVRVTTRGRERVILFDAGVTPTGVAENMRRLEILPGDIETIVLSHGHWDHVAGMEGIAKELGRSNLPVLIHPDFWRRRRIAIPGLEPAELPVTSRSALRARASRSSRNGSPRSCSTAPCS